MTAAFAIIASSPSKKKDARKKGRNLQNPKARTKLIRAVIGILVMKKKYY